LGGGGVDGAIHRAAGKELLQECKRLQGCAVGQAKITAGYRLPARYIIHTVGPRQEKEEDLQRCYKSCLNLCLQQKLRSIAFCCISTGIFGYPVEAATKVALRTVRLWMEQHWMDMDCVIFCTYSSLDTAVYKDLMPIYFPVHTTTEQRNGDRQGLNPCGLGPMVDTQSVIP
jgi:O-acetyl-ADP-ribose deacetylase (regulator of RNase III)